jgi:predicted metal-dependent peptidase
MNNENNIDNSSPIEEEILEEKEEEKPLTRQEYSSLFNEFENACHKAIEEQGFFFAAISRGIKKNKVSRKECPTMGVRWNKHLGRFEMVYSLEFVKELKEKVSENALSPILDTEAGREAQFRKNLGGIIVHELYHIFFNHLTNPFGRSLVHYGSDGKPRKGFQHGIWNIALDLSINCFIKENLPVWTFVPGDERFSKAKDYPGMTPELKKLNQALRDLIKTFAPFETGEVYYQLLMESKEVKDLQEYAEKNGMVSFQECSIDDHGAFDEDENGQNEATVMNQKARSMVQKAKDESERSARWGSISAELRKYIEKYLKSYVNWKSILRMFLQQSVRLHKSSSIKVINRKYPGVHPGDRIQRVAKIGIAIDQSGSVSDQLLAKFFAEISALSKIVEFVVIPFDCHVDESKVYTWKKGQNKPVERVLSGGTDFNAPTEWANANKVDGLIILTDMEAPAPNPCRVRRMWITKEGYHKVFETNEQVLEVPLDD